MDRQAALQKRIKRHIIAQEHDFFIITTQGFEAVCEKELIALAASCSPNRMKDADKQLKGNQVNISRIKIVPGGIEFSGRLPDCYLANLRLRTANRILMRIDQFKATNFIQLKKHLADFPWELYLFDRNLPNIHVTTEKSRLYHTNAIQLKFIEAIRDRMNTTPFLTSPEAAAEMIPQLFVRVVHDRFVVSLDSSGALLYLRGIKNHGGRAPIRETIAAAALQLAGFPKSSPLIDPMCGTGTFSIEAAMVLIGMPAGGKRYFAFMGWPCYRPKQFEYLKKRSESESSRATRHMIFASDIDPVVCEKLTATVENAGLSSIIQVKTNNFFDLKGGMFSPRPGVITLNPPYGNRLGTPSKTLKLFADIFDKLKADFIDWKIILVMPDGISKKTVPFRLSAHRFAHGGLNPTLLVGTIK